MKRDLVIFSGQSNMQGETERPPENLSCVEGALEYRFLEDELVLLKHPVGENIDHFGKPFNRDEYEREEMLRLGALFAPVKNNTNMVPSFCKSYIEETGREIVAVHAAKGSTRIEYWGKGGPGYEIMCKKAKAAILKSKPDNIFFVWLQGESDAIEGKKKDVYKSQLAMLMKNLKEDLSVNKFGMILVGRFTKDERDFEIINAQKEICMENEDFIMLTEITEEIISDVRYLNPNVGGHYNADGQELIGHLAGKALGEYAKKNTI